MTVTETVFYKRIPIGQIVCDDNANLANFKPNRDKLRPLATQQWVCPVHCREDVLAYADKVLGVS